MSDAGSSTLGRYIRVKHGFAFKGEYFTDDVTPDVLVTPGNFTIGGGFKNDKLKYYAGPVPEDYVLQTGDLVVTMTDLSKAGDTLGYPALVPESTGTRFLHNQRIGLVEISDNNNTDKRFLFYRLCADDYRNHVLATASGSTVRHTSPSRICEFKTTLPHIDEQRAIAGVLAALDDKIEQNRRMSRILEMLARAIFRAWFVDFEPVKAKAAGAQSFPSMTQATFHMLRSDLVNSPLGLIPDGWNISGLDQILDVNPPYRLPKGIVAPYLDMGQMPTNNHSPDGWVMREVGSGAKFTNGDTLVARITPCLENGKTAYVDFLAPGEIAWGSTEYIVLRPKAPIPGIYAYLLARSTEFRAFAIQNMTGTSGRQRVPFNALSKYQIAVPPLEIFSAFADIMNPLFQRSNAAARESRMLVKLRYELLPKLMTGKLRVKSGGER